MQQFHVYQKGIPRLLRLQGSFYKVNGPADWTFTLTDGNYPYFLVHLDHRSRLFRMEVYDALTGKDWHRAYQEECVASLST